MQWRMKNGRLIEISEMADSHLANTILMLERNLQKAEQMVSAAYRFASMLQGEMATYYADRDCEFAEDELAERTHRSRTYIEAMQEELRKRGHGKEARFDRALTVRV